MKFKIPYLRLCKILLSSLLASAAGQLLAEDGVTETTILIGQTVGLSGQIAGPVKEMTAGAGAYFAAMNKSGGVHGRKIELRILDDQFDPALAAANAETLIKKEHVLALFQSRGTPHTEALLALLATHKLPLIAPSTGATVFHQKLNRFVFNVRAKYQDEVVKAIEQFSTIGIKAIALVHVDDTFGRDGLAGFEKGMAQHKLTPVSISKYDRIKPDVDGVVANVVKANPAAVIIVGSAATTADMIKKIRAQGPAIQLMTLSNNASQSFIDSLGSSGTGVMMSQIMPAPSSMSSVLGQEFKLMAQAHGVQPSYAAMEGFVAAKVLVEGLKRAGRNLTRESLISGLESMRRVDLGGLMVSYSEREHNGSEFVELTMIGKDGKFLR
ncbi:MAG: ABC transporter substrate-binding protein [Undibacterium sp.]|uniref:ABC transporter substrate-binding protein n=1 Tax=Undibacterium sp. TaxID=1914977 RepID=UPI00271D21C7|nr:ABC transporter substrate-binding protein [Undibacterium sp.]MDO8654037.1 ABC transporter substrate-binding protein [Undibacterium sp.]